MMKSRHFILLASLLGLSTYSCAATEGPQRCDTARYEANCRDGKLYTCAHGSIEEKPCASGLCEGKNCKQAELKPTNDPCQGITCTDDSQCQGGACTPKDITKFQEGMPCDESSPEFCLYGKAVYCILDEDSEKTLIQHHDCGPLGGRCDILHAKKEGKTTIEAWCKGPAEQCQSEGQRIGYCKISQDQQAYQSYYECHKNVDGNWTAIDAFLIGKYERCIENACLPDQSACQGKALGDHCDFESDCQDNVLIRCLQDKGHIHIDREDCSKTKRVCKGFSQTEGTVHQCSQACETEGLLEEVCDASTDFGTIHSSTFCIQDLDGALYSFDSEESCQHGCNAEKTSCAKGSEDEGQTCDPNSFKDRCDGDIAIICPKGLNKVFAQNCKKADATGPISPEDLHCSLIEGKAQCLSFCQKEGLEKQYCYREDDAYRQIKTTCIKDQLGQLIEIAQDQQSFLCEGCATDGKTGINCKPSEH